MSVVQIYCDYHGHSRRKNIFMYGCSNALSWYAADLLKAEIEDQSYKVYNSQPTNQILTSLLFLLTPENTVTVSNNKTGTSKVGAISKAQKAQKTFFFRKMSHNAEKCKRGTLWALLTYILLQNIKKLERGTPLRH